MPRLSLRSSHAPSLRPRHRAERSSPPRPRRPRPGLALGAALVAGLSILPAATSHHPTAGDRMTTERVTAESTTSARVTGEGVTGWPVTGSPVTADRVRADRASAEAGARPRRAGSYRAVVAADRPTAHLRSRRDLVTGARVGRTVGGRPGWTRMPNGARARVYSGAGEHLSFRSRPAYSIPTTGQLTVELWIRPDTLQFRNEEGTGYVYLLGKGDPGRDEWYVRMYSRRNAEGRPNRLSGYAFNPRGGLGAGSYVQDAVTPGRWIQLALVFDQRPRPGAPTGRVRLYKDGVLRDTDALAGYGIGPTAGRAPLRIGTGDRDSYFEGAIGDVVFFDRALRGKRIRAHHRAMVGR